LSFAFYVIVYKTEGYLVYRLLWSQREDNWQLYPHITVESFMKSPLLECTKVRCCM